MTNYASDPRARSTRRAISLSPGSCCRSCTCANHVGSKARLASAPRASPRADYIRGCKHYNTKLLPYSYGSKTASGFPCTNVSTSHLCEQTLHTCSLCSFVAKLSVSRCAALHLGHLRYAILRYCRKLATQASTHDTKLY